MAKLTFKSQKRKENEEFALAYTRGHSMTADIWRRLLRDKSSVVSMGFLCIIFLLAIFANLLFDEALVTAQDYSATNQPPSFEHWFGTDLYGRDIFIRMVFGSRVSLAIGIITMAASMIIGGLLGAIAAYFGGKLDGIIMRVTDMFMAIPETLLALCGFTLADVKAGKLEGLDQKMKALGEEALAERCGVGVPTLLDIAAELQKPGRDPRDELPKPILRTDVLSIADLKPGMELTGTVRNVVDFGAFVDVGVHQDGLVHISQICDRFIRHPSEKLAVGDVVTVWVLEVDEKRRRISLTMKKPA